MQNSDSNTIRKWLLLACDCHVCRLAPQPTLQQSMRETRGDVNITLDSKSGPFEVSMEQHEFDISCGDIIHLCFSELSSYMVAECDSHDSAGDGNVHFRERIANPEKQRKIDLPTNSIYFWQVELAGHISGREIKWGEVVRLRHVPTQKYLSTRPPKRRKSLADFVTDSDDPPPKLSLQSDPSDVHTQFVFHPIDEPDAQTISHGTFARVESVATHECVRPRRTQKYTRSPINVTRGEPALSKRMQELEWDVSTLFTATTAVKENDSDCAMCLTLVDLHQVDNSNFVSGVIPVLNFYCDTRSVRELQPAEAARVVDTLREICEFVYDNGVAMKCRQKLFRGLMLMDLLIKMLVVPFRPPDSEPEGAKILVKRVDEPINNPTKRVANAVFGVIKVYLDGQSRKNEEYMAQHIAYLYTLVGGLLDVEPLFAELFRDNERIVSKISELEIDKFVQLLANGDKDPDYLTILSVFCTCNDSPNRKNQELIAKKLLQETAGTLFRLSYEDERKGGQVRISTDNGDRWFELDRFLRRTGQAQAEVNAYLEAQIRLLVSLGAYRNSENAQLIIHDLDLLTWDVCFGAVKDNNLPSTVREAFACALKTFFIDVDPHVDFFAELQLNYSFEELSWDLVTRLIAEEDDAGLKISATGSTLEHVPKLMDWMHVVVKDFATQIYIDSAGNKLLHTILEMLELVVVYGFYTDTRRITNLVQNLTALLDGRADRATRGPPEMLRQIMSLDQGNGVKVKTISDEEWLATHRFLATQNNHLLMEAKCKALDVLIVCVRLSMSARLQRLIVLFKTAHEGTQLTGQHTTDRLVAVGLLKALTGTTGDPRFMKPTAESFMAFVSFRSSWFSDTDNADEVEMPAEGIIDVLFDLTQYEFAPLYLRSVHLIRQLFSSSQDLCDAACSAVLLSNHSSIELNDTLQHNVPALKRACSGGATADPATAKQVIKIMTMLTTKCRLSSSNEAHAVNQQIIFNTGLVYLMIDLIKIDGQRTDLLSAIFGFLAAISNAFEPAQRLLSRHIDLMLSCEGVGNGWQDEMADALISIFHENELTCRNISPGSINTIVMLVCNLKTDAPNLLKALCVFTRLEKKQIIFEQNQLQIMKSLIREREHCLNNAFVKDIGKQVQKEGNKKTNRLLKFKRSIAKNKSPQHTLAYHMGMLRLLVSCADGVNAFIQSASATIISVRTIIDILDSPVAYHYKTSYFRFLALVYLRTDTPVPSGTGRAAGMVTNSAAQIATIIKAGIKQLATIGLGADTTSGSDGEGQKKSHSDNVRLDEQQHEYCFDGFLPFLLELLGTVHDEWENEIMPVVSDDDLLRVVVVFIATVLPALRKPNDLDVAQNVVQAVCNRAKNEKNQNASFKRGKTSSLPNECTLLLRDIQLTSRDRKGMTYVVSHAVYAKEFQAQIELNDSFNSFARKLLHAYQGENIIETQMPESNRSKFRGKAFTADMLKMPYCEPEGSDEYLPLGTEFSLFVQLFMVNTSSTLTLNERAIVGVIKVWAAVTKFGKLLARILLFLLAVNFSQCLCHCFMFRSSKF